MAHGALQGLTDSMDRRARGEKVLETRELRREADYLRSALATDSWTFGPVGSTNTPMYASAALGRWADIAAACRLEQTEGLFGAELGAPSGFYYAGVLAVKLLALRELRRAGEIDQAADVALAIRAALAWDALVALPVGRLRDRVLIADEVDTSETPGWSDGLTVAVCGNRWTPHKRGEATSEDAHSSILALAIDWQPRATRGEALRGALASVLGTKRYLSTTSAEAWGLTAEEKSLLCQVVAGDVAAAREASGWIFGTKPARLPDHPDPWTFRLRRTSDGVEQIFFGPWPNPNKPARAATQVFTDGTWLGLQPSHDKDGPAKGYRVEVRDGQIVASSDQSGGEHSIPELGGELLWQVDVVGLDVTFTAGGAA
jgi:hypothetical protein